MKYRIGIDVGGTFTDAALVDNDTFTLIDTAKVPTTHSSQAGVAEGIVQVLALVMEKNSVSPEDIVFIAHGTTQATNALLEGDVVKVGIVTVGTGIEGLKSKSDTRLGDISLTSTKFLYSENEYVDASDPQFVDKVASAIAFLQEKNCRSVVAAEAFSVDRPENENRVTDICREAGIPGNVIGHIDIYDDYTFVDVPAEYAKDIMVAMKNNRIKSKKVNIEIAKKK